MTEAFKSYINEAISAGKITGAAVSAVNRNGEFLLNEAFGKTGLGNDAKDFTMNTTFWIASSTKLLTSICVLQLHEQGKLNVHDPVSNVLHEWKQPQILVGFKDDDSGEPILKPTKTPITMVHLLTHSSGMGYDSFNEDLIRYREYIKMPAPGKSKSVSEEWVNVLVFEPGTKWEYGVGIDWAGLYVERITGMTLGEYMKKNIFDVLGMESTMFNVVDNPGMMERMHGRLIRGSEGELVKLESQSIFPVTKRRWHGGGGDLYSTTADYIKVLRSLLLQDGKLLQLQTVEEYMRKGYLSTEARRDINEKFRTPRWGKPAAMGWPWSKAGTDIEFDYGLGSGLVHTAIDGLSGERCMFWSGLPNNNWYVDVARGVAAHYGTWIVPPGDTQTNEVYTELKKAIYKEMTKSKDVRAPSSML